MNINFKKTWIAAYCLLLLAISINYLAAVEDPNFSETISSDQISASDNQQYINPFNSFLKSALIPGWGEISMGAKAGYVSLAMEFFLWGGIFYFQEEVKLHERDSYLYALQHANIKPNDYDDDFLHKLTRYNSSGFEPGGYNEHIYRQAVNLYPDDEGLQNEYIKENAILDQDMFWSWEDRDKRRIYSIKRKNADHNRDYVKFVTGAIVANHIISAINSLRIANNKNRRQRVEFGIDFSHPRNPTAQLKYRF